MWCARTMVEHGAIIKDKTGGGVGFQFREYKTPSGGVHNPWPDVLPLYKTTGDAGNRYMTCLPWHQARIVDPEFSR